MPFKLVISLSNEAQKHFKLQQHDILSNTSHAGVASANTYHIDLFIEINDSSQDNQNKIKDMLKTLDISHIRFFDHPAEFTWENITHHAKASQVDVLVDDISIQKIRNLRTELILALKKDKIPYKSLIETTDWTPHVPLLTYQNSVDLTEVRAKFKNTAFTVVSVSAKEQQTILFSEPLLQLIPKERTFDGKPMQFKDNKFLTFQDCLGKKSMYGSTATLDVDLSAYTPPTKK